MTGFIKPFLILSLLAGGILAKSKPSFLPKTFKADFSKEEKSELSGKITKSQGVISYQYPSRIRMEFSGEEKAVFVSNPFETFYYKPPFFEGTPGELTINKTKDVHFTAFFDSLEKGLKTNDLYKVEDKGDHTFLGFTKVGLEKMKLISAKLFFDGKKEFSHLKKVTITLDNQKEIAINLNHVKANVELTQDTFEFKTPENTRVSK